MRKETTKFSGLRTSHEILNIDYWNHEKKSAFSNAYVFSFMFILNKKIITKLII